MKKLIILLTVSMFLVSCGNDNNEVKDNEINNETVIEDTNTTVKEVLSEEEINEAIEELFSDSDK